MVWTVLRPVLVYLVITASDYITGLSAAFIRGTMDSHTAKYGFLRKFGILLLLASCYCLEFILPEGIGSTIGSIALIGLSVAEVISITENLGLMGVKLPPIVVNNLARLESYDGVHLKDEDETEDE